MRGHYLITPSLLLVILRLFYSSIHLQPAVGTLKVTLTLIHASWVCLVKAKTQVLLSLILRLCNLSIKLKLRKMDKLDVVVGW